MALKNSGFTGQSSLHDIIGLCDLCGLEANSEVAEVSALDCSFQSCPPESAMYHQACLEKYLKSIRLERNRKIGFPCPRGCGKGTKYSEACRGKVLKSHPVMIRSEGNKKRRQAELEQLQQVQRSNLAQQEKDQDKGKKAAKKEEPAPSGKAAKAAATNAKAKGPIIKALNVANTTITSRAPPKTAAQVQKEQLAAAARDLKNEIAGRGASAAATLSRTSSTSASGRLSTASSAKKEVRTLDEYLAERSTPGLERASSSTASGLQAAASLPSAWGRSRASSQSSLQDDGFLPIASDETFPAPSAAAPSQTAASGAAAAAGAVGGRPPLPPRAGPAPVAAPVAPLGAWATRAGEPSSSSQPSSTSPTTPALVGAGAAAQLGAGSHQGRDASSKTIPGMEAPPGEAKLSKAQRKNLKRAEKKAHQAKEEEAAVAAAADSGSVVGESTSEADAYAVEPSAFEAVAAEPVVLADSLGAGASGQGEASELERCVPLLVQHKLQCLVEQLQQLGFPAPACLAAVQAHGSNLEGAISQLLEQTTGVVDSMHSLGMGGAASSPEVDVSAELQRLQGLQARHCLPLSTLEGLLAECRGDLDSLERTLASQSEEVPQYEHAQAGVPASPVTMASPSSQYGLHSSPGLFDATSVAPEPAAASGWGDYSATSAPSAFSAFGFSGLTEAAVQAVRGTQTQHSSMLSSVDSGAGLMGTPPSHDRIAAPAAGSGLWSDLPSPHGSGPLPSAPGTDLGSLFGGPQVTASSSYDLWGCGQTGGLSPFDKPSHHAAPFPGASLGSSAFAQHPEQPGQLGGYSASPFDRVPGSMQEGNSLWGGVPNTGGLGLGFGASQQQGPGYGAQLEESELNQLMATLGCR